MPNDVIFQILTSEKIKTKRYSANNKEKKHPFLFYYAESQTFITYYGTFVYLIYLKIGLILNVFGIHLNKKRTPFESL